MESTKTQSPYFLSMADLLIGVLFIFLIIMFYFALNFSEFAKFAKEYEEDKNLIVTLTKENEDLKTIIEDLTAQNKDLEDKLGNAKKRAKEAERRATEIENFILSVNETKIEILKKIQARLMKLDFRVEIDEKTGVIRLPQKEMFATAEHKLSSDGVENINKLSIVLGEILPCYSKLNDQLKIEYTLKCKRLSKNKIDAVFIEGHADARPFYSPTIKDNQELSTKRALSAFNAITSNEKISRLKNSNNEFLLSVSGYGDKRPLPCFDSQEVCYSKDRRIDLRFIMEIPKKMKSNINFD